MAAVRSVQGVVLDAMLHWTEQITTHVCCNSATDFPESRTDERRLAENTSGRISVNMWWFARSRRILAAGGVNEQS